jgi:hypothetical protein
VKQVLQPAIMAEGNLDDIIVVVFEIKCKCKGSRDLWRIAPLL